MNDLAQLEVSGRIATLALNRPEARNALSLDLLAALHTHVDELARRTITVESPDKSISVQVSGKLEVQTISLNPKVVQDAAAGGPAVHAQLEQLVQRAVNIALSKAKDAIAEGF